MAEETVKFENKIKRAKNIEELKEVIKELPQMTFYSRLDELCEKYNKKYAEIQIKTNITKSLFYEIISPAKKRTPQKYQIILIGLAMGATVEEVNELLKLAKLKELYAKNKADAIIIFGIENKMSDTEIEELLIQSGADFSLFERKKKG